MAVHWSEDQRAQAEVAISAFPVESGRCADLARRLRPVAAERDPEAHALLIRPKPGSGRYVVPRAGPKGWFHHLTTVVEAHCVDALTGVDGTERRAYLGEHWEFSERLRMDPVDLEEPWL